MEHECMVMTLRLSSSSRSEVAKFTAEGKSASSSQQYQVHVDNSFRHPRHCPQGIRTPWSYRQWQVLLWGFEAAEGGHSAQTYRHVEEKQLVSPPWQRVRSHITRCSTIPDFQNITVIPHPPHSPYLTPCDFFLFPNLKLRLKGRRFDTTEETHAESQEVIDTLTFENFQGCMRSWEERWDRCKHAQGGYFEGDGGNYELR